jgi:hypothetical protein
LTDGVLTDKERAVILKKAEGMGLDPDEIDLYLDAEVQKIDQTTDAAARKQKGKQCPYCGGSVPLLTDKCPHCGENITAQASEELQDIFDNLEESLIDLKSGKEFERSKATVERFARKAKMYYGSNPKAPCAIIKQSENGRYYVEGEYSDEYLECIKQGKTFVIKDEDSLVFKRQCVSKRVPVEGTNRKTLVQLDIENLEEYWEE